MGAQMTKELGVYNEEEKVCTPQGPQRYRLINNDPRSATAGIKRTPIQVQCTPTNSKNSSDLNVVEVNRSFEEEMENDKERIVGSVVQENLEDVNDSEEQCGVKNVVVETKTKCYLETDMDKLDSFVSNTFQHLAQPNEKPILELSDVRSPSLEIARTPVLVQCTPELFALHARIDSMSFYDFEVHTDDPSAILTDDDPSAIVSDEDPDSPRSQTPLKKWLIDVENKAYNNSPNTNSPKTVAKKQKELNSLKKKLFFSPDAKDTSRPKARTPLGNLQASQVGESPQKLMRAKQWRNIQEERQRRGIIDTENTPPSLPPLSKVSSAPGKILDCKRTKTLWDEENTMYI